MAVRRDGWGLITAKYRAEKTAHSAKHEYFSAPMFHKVHSSKCKPMGQGQVGLCWANRSSCEVYPVANWKHLRLFNIKTTTEKKKEKKEIICGSKGEILPIAHGHRNSIFSHCSCPSLWGSSDF